MKPTIATLTATFNRAHTLRRAIQSCQNQTYPVSEIIIVDDGSTDETPSLVSDLASKDPRIRYLRLPVNQGELYAQREGIKMSGSDWVALIDSDDELLPHAVETRLLAVERCGFSPGLVYGDLYYRLSEQSPAIETRYERLVGNVYPKILRKEAGCMSSTMMMRRECFKITGFPDPNWPHFQDRAMAFTIARRFPILHAGDFIAVMYGDAGNRISSSAERGIEGIRLWIKTYRSEILRYHGPLCLFFWNLYVVRIRLCCFRSHIRQRHSTSQRFKKIIYLYSKFLDYGVAVLHKLLDVYFKQEIL